MAEQTSIDAYHTIKENGLLKGLQLQVYEFLKTNGPSTRRDVIKHFRNDRVDSGSYGTRLSELESMGVVRNLGLILCAETSHKVKVWGLTNVLPRKIKKLDTFGWVKILDHIHKRIYHTMGVCQFYSPNYGIVQGNIQKDLFNYHGEFSYAVKIQFSEITVFVTHYKPLPKKPKS